MHRQQSQTSTSSGGAEITFTVPDSLTQLKASDFEITTKELGEGGFAKVMVGQRKGKADELYAIKVVNKANAARSAFTNLQVEIDVVGSLSHPNIVNCKAVWQDPVSLYFALELCEGGELFKYIKKFGLDDMPTIAPNLIGEAVLALEYMQLQGVIHRDIKPENLLLTKTYHVKIADFGTACRVDSEDNKFTGTAEYVSPEVLKDGKASKTSDVWALGCTIYQMFVGRPPFQAESQYLIFQAIKAGVEAVEFPPASYFPSDAKDLVIRMLHADPEQRIGAKGFAEIKAHPFFAKVDWANIHTASNVTHINDDHTHKWSNHLFKGEECVYSGVVDKARKLSVKRRNLILTTGLPSGPRLFYVDPATQVQKGQIQWSDDMYASASSDKEFDVVTPGRTYDFTSPEGYAHVWAAKINSLLKMSPKKGGK